MGRERSRLSRGLIGILTIIIAIGLVAYFHEQRRTGAAEKPKISTALATPAGNPAREISNPAQTRWSAARTERSLDLSRAARQAGDGHDTGDEAFNPADDGGEEEAVGAQLSGNPLADGKAKMDAGDLLGARRILNAALLSGALSDADATSAKSMMSTISQTTVFSPKHFADDEYGGTYTVQPGELLTKIAAQHDVTWQFLCRANGLADPKRLCANATIKVIKGPFRRRSKSTSSTWKSGSAANPTPTARCYVTSFPVGLGRDDSTPTGKWMIQPGNKIKDPTYYSPRGEGVIEAGDPKNPLGQFWLGLQGTDGHAVGKMSYGIHGTIDPDSIGKQESMGCIRMRNEDVAQVFELLVEGKSTVVVKD